MLKLNAVFHRKDINLRPRDCVVEKVIPLIGAQFRRFASDMLADWDFIKDNIDLMRMDTDGTYYCILVTGEGCENGILVESEGSSYARYAAHVPHVHSIIAANCYPAIADLTNKLTAMADHIVEAAARRPQGENRVFVSMDKLEEISGIDVAYNTAITDTLTKMLNERPEIADWELDKNEFIVTPAPAVPEQKQDTYNSVILLGKPALFTFLRVDRNTVPSGLFAYDIRHNDNGMAVSVEPNVSANHMGTVIISVSLDFGKDGYIALNNKNGGLNFACDHGCTTIAEYTKYLQNSSQTQTAEPEQTQEMTMSM